MFLLNEDHSNLERIVLSVVRRVELKIAMLVLGDELESIVEWNVHIRRDGPLRCRSGSVRVEAVVPDTRREMLMKREDSVDEAAVAVLGLQRRIRRKRRRADGVVIAAVHEPGHPEKVLSDRIGAVNGHAIEVVFE